MDRVMNVQAKGHDTKEAFPFTIPRARGKPVVLCVCVFPKQKEQNEATVLLNPPDE